MSLSTNGDQMTDPDSCNSMTELRLVIDQIDDELIDLMAIRQKCIDRAVELKQIENLPANIPDRVAEVISNVTARAEKVGLDPDLVAFLWSEIVQRAIAREDRTLTPNSPTKD